MTKTDAEIQKDVLRELAWDSRVKETDIGVAVKSGVVTLTGTVNCYAERLAAKEAAHRVAGVLDVANDVHVQVPRHLERNDTEIALTVRKALEWDALVPEEQIHTTVTDGWVTLEGTVRFPHERDDAERSVRYLAGVRGVTNQIVLAPHLEVAAVLEEIEEALERRADRAARHIRVTVNDGTVTLRGPVRSWAERQAVLGAARFTPGVRAVADQLEIDPTT